MSAPKSSGKPKKKKVVSTKKKVQPTSSKYKKSAPKKASPTLLFKRQNYVLMGAGALLVLLGLLFMLGGKMPSPDVWDDSIIYSFRRTVLAPILILAGLTVEIVAIFKKA